MLIMQLNGQSGLSALGLHGLDAVYGSTFVRDMHQALTALARAANYPAGDPGTTSDTASEKTVSALGAWGSRLLNKIPGSAGTVVSASLQLASIGFPFLSKAQQETVLNQITQYAKEIKTAALGLALAYGKPGAPPPGYPAPGTPGYPPYSYPPVAEPVYKQWWFYPAIGGSVLLLGLLGYAAFGGRKAA